MSKISGVVITYNREDILELCLRSIRFVDELIVVDKSSTDRSTQIAMRYADRYIRVPWTPTVEETRQAAVAQCSHELIVLLDDDECLTEAAGRFIRDEAAAPKFDIYAIPYRHFIVGRHDERAYYWPEYRRCFFKRHAVAFKPTIHGGTVFNSDACLVLPTDSEAAILHFSHADVRSWVEKTNRYTDAQDRVRGFGDDELASIGAFARRKMDEWLSRVPVPDNYLEAVAALRGIYDIVDGLKRWERIDGTGDVPFGEGLRSLQSRLAPAVPAEAPKAFTSDWFSHNIPGWRHILAATGLATASPLIAVELGCFEGRATNWIMDHVAVHPDSAVHCVDTFARHSEPDSYWTRFRANVLTRPDAEKVSVHMGPSFSFLLDFVRSGQRADFIYLDASHRAANVLNDLVLAFRMLNVGGVLICDDYLGGAGPGDDLTLGSPKIAIDAFTTIVRPQIEIVVGQPLYQFAFVKRIDAAEDDPASRGEADAPA